MNEYTARYIKNASQTKTEDVLALESAQITNYYDVGNGFYPKAEARLWYDETGLGVLLSVEETDFTANRHNPNEDVYKDRPEEKPEE